jgi:ribonucleoside-diphosphate reductase alpha chain
MSKRRRLPNRRAAETFEIEVGGLRYTATVGRFADGTIGEVFLNNHKSNPAADVNARDAAIAFSFAIQHGADPEAIRKALSRDSNGNASGPLGAALDGITEEGAS